MGAREIIRRLLETTANEASGESDRLESAARNAERLAKLIHVPTEFSKRRVETLTMESVNRFHWAITQECTIPTLDDDSSEDLLHTGTRVVSLGIYNKTRHPDLIAADACGCQLTVLDRQARGRLLGDAYLAKILKAGGCLGRPLRLTEDEYEALLSVVAQVTALDEERAQIARRYWVSELGRHGGDLARVNRNDEFAKDLATLAREIHLLALVPARPNDSVVVRHSFIEASSGVSYWSDFAGTPPAFSERVWTRPGRFVVRWIWWISFGSLRALLRMLGLVPFLIQLENRNAEHVESLHLVLQAPDGLTIEDAYWQKLSEHDTVSTEAKVGWLRAAWRRFVAFVQRALDKDSRAVAADYRRGGMTTLSAHGDEVEVEDPKYWFGVQLAPSPLLPAGFVVVGLVSLVLGISSLVGEGRCITPGQCEPDSTALGVMLALPGLAAGVLSQARSRVTAKIGKGPRALTLASAIWPYAIAVLLGFGQMEPADLAGWSRGGSSFAAFVAVLLLMIGILPRHPFCTKLGNEGGNGTKRKRWNRLRQFYGLMGLALSVAAGAFAFWFIGDLTA